MRYRITSDIDTFIAWNANGITYLRTYEREGSFDDDGTILSHIVESARELEFLIENI